MASADLICLTVRSLLEVRFLDFSVLRMVSLLVIWFFDPRLWNLAVRTSKLPFFVAALIRNTWVKKILKSWSKPSKRRRKQLLPQRHMRLNSCDQYLEDILCRFLRPNTSLCFYVKNQLSLKTEITRCYCCSGFRFWISVLVLNKEDRLIGSETFYREQRYKTNTLQQKDIETSRSPFVNQAKAEHTEGFTESQNRKPRNDDKTKWERRERELRKKAETKVGRRKRKVTQNDTLTVWSHLCLPISKLLYQCRSVRCLCLWAAPCHLPFLWYWCVLT